MNNQNLPSTLSDFQVFFMDGSWGGVINKVSTPDIEQKTETFTASATGGEKEKVLPVLKPMKAKLTVSDLNPKILGLIGNKLGREIPLVLRGSMDRDGEHVPVKLIMQGDWFKVSAGELATGGEEVTMEVECSLDMYSVFINNLPSLHVDIVNRIFRPDGITDVWADIRKNIGA